MVFSLCGIFQNPDYQAQLLAHSYQLLLSETMNQFPVVHNIDRSKANIISFKNVNLSTSDPWQETSTLPILALHLRL